MSNVTELPPQGWYPDARDPGVYRWWDGSGWTTHVMPVPPPAVAVPVPPPTVALSSQEAARRAAGFEPRADAATPYAMASAPLPRGGAQTLSGWLFAFSPIWSGGVGVLLTIIMPSAPAPAVYVLSGLIVLVLLFGLAVTDGRNLVARGYRATSPGWVLVPLVYFILRTVRTGARGAAVLVVFILVQAIVVIAVVAAAVAAYQAQR